MVTVTSGSPVAPTVFPLTQCGSGFGNMFTIGCLATGFRPAALTFKWTVDGTALDDFVQYPTVEKGDLYTGVSQMNVRREDWESKKVFTCTVEHLDKREDAVIRPPPVQDVLLPTLNVFTSSYEEMKKKKLGSFYCLASEFLPKDYKFKWLRNGKPISDQISDIKTYIGSRETEIGPLYNAASYLQVNDTSLLDDADFTCVAERGQNSTKKSVAYIENLPCSNPDLYFEIEILPLSLEDMFLNKKAQLICEVLEKEQGIEYVKWKNNKDNMLVLSDQRESQRGDRKLFTAIIDITYEEWSAGINYRCVVRHQELIEEEKKVYIKESGVPKRPSVYLLPPADQSNDEVTLTCYVKDFYPKEILVSWLVNDMVVDSTFSTNMTSPLEKNGQFSVYGQLRFSSQVWKHTKTVYNCVVYHESMINSTRVIVRSIMERMSELANLVNLNMSIP